MMMMMVRMRSRSRRRRRRMQMSMLGYPREDLKIASSRGRLVVSSEQSFLREGVVSTVLGQSIFVDYQYRPLLFLLSLLLLRR